MNQIINFSNGFTVEDWDYIEFHLNSSRVNWEWCKGKTFVNFNSHTSTDREATVTIKYFENGSLFGTGTQLSQISYKIRNPMKAFAVEHRQMDIGGTTSARYEMEIVPELCVLVVRSAERRLASFPIYTVDGRCEVPLPRVAGEYEIAVLGGSGRTLLAKQTIAVRDLQSRGAVKLTSSLGSGSRLLTVKPGDSVDVTALGGILQDTDEVVVVEVRTPDTTTNHTDLLTPVQTQTLQRGRTVHIRMESSGIYHVCLGLMYCGSRLVGDYLCVVVSQLAAPLLLTNHSEQFAAAQAPLNVVPQPMVPLPQLMNAPTSSGFCCVACQDGQVCVKLEPCKHVALCERCCALVRSGNNKCPCCRVNITGTEKVFVVGAQ